ncbi:MAG TPA: glycosyl hydrolase [Anaerolineae bacterium]
MAVRKKPTQKATTGKVGLLVGTRKGAFILQSDRTRRKWKIAPGIMIGAIVHHMVLDPRDKKTILMCASTGHLGPTIFRSLDLGRTWTEAKQPPAFPKAPEGEKGRVVHHNFWLSPGHASEPNVWYVGTSPQGLFRSEDGGVTWEGVKGLNEDPNFLEWKNPDEEGNAPPGGATLHSVMIDPRDARHMYLALSGGGFFESNDKGANWHPLGKGMLSSFLPVPDAEVGHDVHLARMHPLYPDRLWQQSHEGVYRMDRPEGVWVDVGKNLPKRVSPHSYPIAVHPRNPDQAWLFPLDGGFPLGRVSPDGKPATYTTKNAGKTWQRQEKGFPKSNGWFTVRRQAMITDTHDPVGVYLGTTGGELWVSVNEGESWKPIALHLPEIYSVEVAEI